LHTNAHGLWRLEADDGGNRLSNQPWDTTRFEHLIASMKLKCLDVYFLQDMWLEDDKFDIDVGGYHLFCHNGPNGNHLHHGVAIVLLPCYYVGWKVAGATPLITTNTTNEFVGCFIGITIKLESRNKRGRMIKGKKKRHLYYRWYWRIIRAALRMTTKDFLTLLTPSSANYRQAREISKTMIQF
jgi:hypothetical protein